MKLINSCLLPGIIAILFCSCSSTRELTYLQGGENLKLDDQKPYLYDARIMPKDLLTITISCSEAELAAPFNQGGNISSTAGAGVATGSAPTYLVDNNGHIDFPLLGELPLGGMTKKEAETAIKERLKAYLKETPLVNVRLANYKFSVLGEVQGPGTFTAPNEKVNIFEAVAMAGDMTVYAIRDRVKLLREDVLGRKEMVVLNLQDPSVLTSPYYYLQQNDIVFVEGNKAKAQNTKAQNILPWLSVVTVLTSLTSMAIVIFR